MQRSGLLLWFALISCFHLAHGQSPQPPSGHPHAPQPDYRARTIYFLVADRFNPHHPYHPYIDPQYPYATNTVNCFAVPCPEEEQYRRYWGGDIPGIEEKLPYLRRFGVSALWITPLMENVRAYEGGTAYGTGYHGYWIQNYYRVNAHFGNWTDVDALAHNLHAAGMHYMQDITLNHSNPLDNHVFGRLYETSATDNIFINSYADDYDPEHQTRYYKHYNNTPQCLQVTKDYNEIVPDSQWTYWQLHHCLLADLSGYNQHDPAVANYLIGAGQTWMNHGVDDFRLDAIKFPYPDFVARFTHSMIRHAAGLDRPASPYFVGEWSNGGVGDSKSLRFANSYSYFATNILDFQLSFELNRFIGGAHEFSSEQRTAEQLDSFLHQRVSAFHHRDTWQGTFLDNHDQIRTIVRLQKIGISSEAERERRMDLGLVLLLTVRGVPIVFYGDEQYLAHYNDHQSTPPQYVNTGNDDPWNRTGMVRWDEWTPAFRIVHQLARLRRHSPAVQKGAYQTIYAHGDILVFERRCEDETVLVAVNRGQHADTDIDAGLHLPAGTYKGVLQNTGPSNRGNNLTVTPGHSTLRLNKLSALVIRSKAADD